MVSQNSSVVSNVYAKFELLNIIKMPKKIFKPGEFVRTLSTNGPIGGLLIVDEMVGERVAVHHVPECGIGSFMRLPNRLVSMRQIVLYVTPQEAKELEDSKHFNFTKVQDSALWDKALTNNDYDVAILVNRAENVRFILENPEFSDPYKNVLFFQPVVKNITVVFSKKTKLPL